MIISVIKHAIFGEKIMKNLLVVFYLCFFLFSVCSCDFKPKNAGGHEKSDSIVKADSIAKAQLPEKQKELDSLKQQFDYIYEVPASYIHKFAKQLNNINRPYLEIQIIEEFGSIMLTSNYTSPYPFYYSHLAVMINGKIYMTSDALKENIIESRQGGQYRESIIFEEDKCLDFVAAIAQNTDSDLSVRFSGNLNHDEIVLSAETKQMIKESYELSMLIKHLNKYKK